MVLEWWWKGLAALALLLAVAGHGCGAERERAAGAGPGLLLALVEGFRGDDAVDFWGGVSACML